MNAIIIEDEVLSAKRLKNLLNEISPMLKVEQVLDSIEASVKWLKTHQHPTVIFMDIQLSDGICFEIFKQVEIKTFVIFTTAYDEYALDAFKVNSIDYLLKPIDKDFLVRSLNKLNEIKFQQLDGLQDKILNLLHNLEENSNNKKSRFLIKSGHSYITIFDNEIAYFISDRKLTILVTHNGKKHTMDESLDELEKQVNQNQFFRVNRQFILSITSISSVHKYFDGKLKLHLRPESENEVVVSREKAKSFKNWLGK